MRSITIERLESLTPEAQMSHKTQTVSSGSQEAGKAGFSRSGRVPLGVDSRSGPSLADGRLFRRGTG